MISAFAKTLLATACLAAGTYAASAQGAADFYKGKTVQIVVGFGVGGGYDLYARALSRYLGKHLPGNPNVVVQNMEGAGSVRAANYVYAGSPQDGTVIAAVNQNVPMYQLLGGAGARFEAAQLQWLGSMTNSNGTGLHVAYERHQNPRRRQAEGSADGRGRRAIGFGDLPESDERDARHQVQADHRLCRLDANPSRHGARRGHGPRRQQLVEPADRQYELAQGEQGQPPGAGRLREGAGPSRRSAAARSRERRRQAKA